MNRDAVDISLESCGFSLEHDEWGKLVYTDALGNKHVGVEPIRGFPLTDLLRGISLLAADGRELAWIERLSDVPGHTRAVIEEEFSRREFMPIINRIVRATVAEPSQWEVETDRGPTTFLLKGDDDVRRLDDRRAMVVDAHGVRYLIRDTKSLDAVSRRYLERYL